MIAQHIFTSPSPLLKLFYCAPFFIHFWQSCITPAVQCHIKWPCYYHQCSGEEKWPTLLLLRKHWYSKASNKHGLSFSWGSNGNNKPGDDIDYNRQPFELRLASICFSAFLIFQYLFKTSGFFMNFMTLFSHRDTWKMNGSHTFMCTPFRWHCRTQQLFLFLWKGVTISPLLLVKIESVVLQFEIKTAAAAIQNRESAMAN